MSDIETKRQALAKLDSRLAAGEIGGEEYERLRVLLTSGLTADQCARLGVTQTPAPRSVLGLRMGPSGGQTRMPTIAELELEPGTVLLDQWKIIRELGRGGFGVVFEAEDIKLDRTVAVKVLDPAMAARADLLARFRREVTLMRELAHERIVRVYDYREEARENLALITMEYVGGCSVHDVLALARASKEPVSVELALAIFEQTLEALAAAHVRGVIHRDVTPGNILLAGGRAAELLADPGLDPRVKLVDFGIAGLVERTELSAKSRVLGTAAYVAPEVLDPDAEITPEADVFGAGAVVYELLTGKTPLVTGYRPVAELRDCVPPSLAEVIVNSVRPIPGGRPSSMRVLQVLKVFRTQNGEKSRTLGGAAPVHARDSHRLATTPAIGHLNAGVRLDQLSSPAPPAAHRSISSDLFRPLFPLIGIRDVIEALQVGRQTAPTQRRNAVGQGLKAAGQWVIDIAQRRNSGARGLKDVAQRTTPRWGIDWLLMRNSVVWGVVVFYLWRAASYLSFFHTYDMYLFSEYFTYFFVWGVMGIFWGFSQWLCLRRTLKMTKFWIASTTVAFLVFGAVNLIFSFLSVITFVAVFAGNLGVFQAAFLRNRIAKWALWVPAQLLLFPLLIFLFGILGGVGQGLLLSYLKAERDETD